MVILFTWATEFVLHYYSVLRDVGTWITLISKNINLMLPVIRNYVILPSYDSLILHRDVYLYNDQYIRKYLSWRNNIRYLCISLTYRYFAIVHCRIHFKIHKYFHKQKTKTIIYRHYHFFHKRQYLIVLNETTNTELSDTTLKKSSI